MVFHRQANKNSGFTLIEITIVMILVIILASGSVFAATYISLIFGLNTVSHDVVTATEEAKSYSAIKFNGQNNYGIYFTTSSYKVYAGTTYSSSDPVIESVTLPMGVGLSNINFNGNQYVYFAPLTGAASQTGSLRISTIRGSYTLSINSTGVITLTKN